MLLIFSLPLLFPLSPLSFPLLIVFPPFTFLQLSLACTYYKAFVAGMKDPMLAQIAFEAHRLYESGLAHITGQVSLSLLFLLLLRLLFSVCPQLFALN